MSDKSLVPSDFGPIEQVIHVIRDRHVILDVDIARIYGVSTTRLNEQVKRNHRRFPPKLSFRLTQQSLQT